MNRTTKKLQNHQLRAHRVRARIHGTAERPRMSVHVSNRHVLAQVVNDDTHQTIVQVTTVGNAKLNGTLTERASWVGTEIAKKAKAKKVAKVVFDRGGHLYHGRIKALADAARAEGLEF